MFFPQAGFPNSLLFLSWLFVTSVLPQNLVFSAEPLLGACYGCLYMLRWDRLKYLNIKMLHWNEQIEG